MPILGYILTSISWREKLKMLRLMMRGILLLMILLTSLPALAGDGDDPYSLNPNFSKREERICTTLAYTSFFGGAVATVVTASIAENRLHRLENSDAFSNRAEWDAAATSYSRARTVYYTTFAVSGAVYAGSGAYCYASAFTRPPKRKRTPVEDASAFVAPTFNEGSTGAYVGIRGSF